MGVGGGGRNQHQHLFVLHISSFPGLEFASLHQDTFLHVLSFLSCPLHLVLLLPFTSSYSQQISSRVMTLELSAVDRQTDH